MTDRSELPLHFSKLKELRALSKLSLPILTTQLAQIGMGTVDAIMSGHVGTEDLAAIAIGTSLWTPLWLFIAGILLVLSPRFAQYLSAKEKDKIQPLLANGLMLSLLIGAVASVILITVPPLLHGLLPSPATAIKMQDYTFAVALGLPAASGFIALRFHAEAWGHASSVTLIMLSALALNIPINAIFVYGLFGMPELGGVGCGWGTLIVFNLMFIAIFIDCWWRRTESPQRKFKLFFSLQKDTVKQLLKTGLPIGTSIFFEISFFSVIAILLSPLGDTVVAGHQVALNICSLTFMLPLSISLAITVRVGHHIGLKNPQGSAATSWLGVQVNAAMSFLNAALIVIFATALARVYTPDPQVIELASELLLLAAIFQLSDGIQIGAAGALRAYQDTFRVMIITFIAYWLLGIGLGYYLAFSEQFNLGAQGFWWGLIIGLSCAALLLMIRLKQITKNEGPAIKVLP